MNLKNILVSSVLATGIAVFAGYSVSNAQNNNGMMRGQGMGMGHGMMGRGNMVRHRIVRFQGIPDAYMDKKNPLSANAETIKKGKQLYADNCVSCHGQTGVGDGEDGRELSPKPANIAFIMDRWIATDPFLMWSISEGGKALETAMPAFKDVLSEKERWSIVHYLRNGLGG